MPDEPEEGMEVSVLEVLAECGQLAIERKKLLQANAGLARERDMLSAEMFRLRGLLERAGIDPNEKPPDESVRDEA